MANPLATNTSSRPCTQITSSGREAPAGHGSGALKVSPCTARQSQAAALNPKA